MSKKNVINYIKTTLKHIIWLFFQYYKKGDKSNIFIFTSRRSGGTWLTQVISSGKKIKYIIEPFATGSKDVFLKKKYPKHILNTTIPLLHLDKEWMKEFTDDIVSGKLNIKSPWNFFSPQFHFFNDRCCLKIHMSKNWILWYKENYPKDVAIYYLRHPIPQALSSIKRKSELIIDDWLEDNIVNSSYIDQEMLNCIENVKNNGKILTKYVLNWILENVVAINEIDRLTNEIIVLTYEEFVVNSEKVSSLINSECKLDSDDEDLANVSKKPSLTVKGETKEILKKSELDDLQKYNYLLRRWEGQISEEEKNEIQNLFDCFSFKIYNAYNTIPDSVVIRYTDTSEVLEKLYK